MSIVQPAQRLGLAAGACVLVAVLNLASAGSQVAEDRRGGAGQAREWNLEEVKHQLAPVVQRFPERSSLGIITDLRRHIDETPLMVLRFVMAPRQTMVVQPGRPKPEWAVGIFRDAVDPVQAGVALGYRIEERYPTGVVLYRRIRP
jgi:hypothetical protein